MRKLHLWSGLIASLFVAVIGLSGASLSIYPAADALFAPPIPADMNVAHLVERAQAKTDGIEEIRKSADGSIEVYWFNENGAGAAQIDPATGAPIAEAGKSALHQWVQNLHRTLFMGDAGRIIVGLGALSMLVLSYSGAQMIARRAGGWRNWFAPVGAGGAIGLHVSLARIFVIFFFISGATGLWINAKSFDLLQIEHPNAVRTQTLQHAAPLPVAQIELLNQTPVSELTRLTLAQPNRPNGVHKLSTQAGMQLLDPASGALVGTDKPSGLMAVHSWMKSLHTGQGMAWLGILLGLASLSIPVLAITGFMIWLNKPSSKLADGNCNAQKAEIVVLVGSEVGSTNGFASSLVASLQRVGVRVHSAPMSDFSPESYRQAKSLLILTSTYGNGSAPSSAMGFFGQARGI